MALTRIEYGADVTSGVLNDNFDDLDDRIIAVDARVTTTQSNLASINSTLSQQITNVSNKKNFDDVSRIRIKNSNYTDGYGYIVQYNSGKTLFVGGADNSGTRGAGLSVNMETNAVSLSGGTFLFPCCTTKATNTSTAASNKVCVIKENYCNDDIWYRVWSDGWIEQGGRISTNYDTDITIKFKKSFSDKKYCIFKHFGFNNTGGVAARWLGFWNLLEDRATTGSLGGYNQSWYACGY